jgi:hypothetical protein
MSDPIPESDPAAVKIVAPDPVPVEIVGGAAPALQILPGQAGGAAPAKPDVITLPGGRVVAAPTSTEEEERVSASQREVSLIWETTQMKIALSVVWAALAVSTALAIFGKTLGSPELQLAAGVFLFGVANLVTGFYFGRTNHQKVGGVGPVAGR